MRHLFGGMVAAATVMFLGQAAAATTPLAFTLDLTAPCSGGTCTGLHPTDIGLQLQANSFSYAAGSGVQTGSFVTQIGVQAPVACDEVRSNGTFGPTTQTRLENDFTNASPGGLLEFNNLGTGTVVDIGALSYDGSNPPGVAASWSNNSAPQVICYQINPVGALAPAFAAGPGGIFANGFENHVAGEPWVSVQTVRSPQPAVSNYLGYVVQIHNANAATGWHLGFGYDTAFFDPANNGNIAPKWAVINTSSQPQPGPVNPGSLTLNAFSAGNYTVATGDVNPTTQSVYIYVSHSGSSGAVNNWSTLTNGLYPATASIFPPFGTYPQRFDDKSAVATASNLPTQNIGSIVCNNDVTSTQCSWSDVDGNPGAPVVFANTISPTGTVSSDPLVYFADPTSGSSAPGNLPADALAASNISCNDPSGILAGPISFTQSPSAKGGMAAGFSFAAGSGIPYVPGIATCTATFANSGYSPNLSSTISFSITMLQTQANHFDVSAQAGSTAGSAFNFTVTAKDANNNLVPGYNGTVQFTSTDASNQKSLPANSTLSNGTGTFSATLVTAGSKTITATDTLTSTITGTSGAIVITPAAAAGFQVQALTPQTHGQAFQVQVTAKDGYGNTATGYAGTVHFTSSDNSASLPADQTLVSGVASPLPYVTLNTIGQQTVTVTDTVTSSITGVSNSITVN